MQVYYVDMKDVHTKADLYACLKYELPVPQEFGSNLDALHDVLTEYGKDWDIIIYNTAGAAAQLGPYFERFRRMCADATTAFSTADERDAAFSGRGGKNAVHAACPFRIRIYP